MRRFFGPLFPRVVLTAMILLAGTSPELAAKMYWTDIHNDEVSRANLDGTEVQTLVADRYPDPGAIDLDLQQFKMYWIAPKPESIQNVVWRANTDGSAVEELFTQFNALGLAVDDINGKLYVSAPGFEGPGVILRFNLNGTQSETLFTGLNCYDLELDLPAGKLYFLDNTQRSIKRANLDGSDLEVVHEMEDFPSGLALDTDAGQIYWAAEETGSVLDTIRRIDYDGANEQPILSDDEIGALELDPRHDKLYYTRGPLDEGIVRANLDGSDVELIVNDPKAFGLALDPQGVGNDVPATGTAGALALLVLMLLAASRVASGGRRRRVDES